MTLKVCESTVESAALEWFAGLGYNVLNSPQIAPGEPVAEGSQRATHVSWCGRTWGMEKRTSLISTFGEPNEPRGHARKPLMQTAWKLFQKWVSASKTPGKQALRLVFETVS